MRITPKRIRSRVRMVERNCSMLSLADAVAREQKTGFFALAERTEEGGFEAETNDFDTSKSICHMSKVDTALRGIDMANKTVLAPEGKSADLDAPKSEPFAPKSEPDASKSE